jgi:hypothetical protein
MAVRESDPVEVSEDWLRIHVRSWHLRVRGFVVAAGAQPGDSPQ